MKHARIAIVGAGFSGTLVAAHLLRSAAVPLECVLINRSGPLARGLAYGTRSEEHVLNVPAGRMGAYPDDEEGFLRFARRRVPGVSGADFVPRAWYGDYLESILTDAEHQASPGASLVRIPAESVNISLADSGRLALTLRDGGTIDADRVVLALGNFTPSNPRLPDARFCESPAYIRDPWAPGALTTIRPAHPTLLLGTGLTMADVALTIVKHHAHTRLYTLSRRGLLPQSHRSPSHAPTVPHLPPDLMSGPPSARAYLRSIRRHIRVVAAEGLDWRDVIGSLRAVTPDLWARLETSERARFLRHVRVYWEVHRHRAAPQVGASLERLIRDGQLTRLAGRIVSCRATPDGARLEIGMRGTGEVRTLTVGHLVNCTGPDSDLGRVDESLIRSLHAQGLLVPDSLGLGLFTDHEYRLRTAQGGSSPAIFYVGPLLKATFWESTAVPELREHAARAAAAVIRSLSVPTPASTVSESTTSF